VKILIDTWGWLTLQDKREHHHREVKNLYQNFRQSNGIAYTSDYILDETITLLFRRLPFSVAVEFLKDIDRAVEEKYLHLERITSERFNKAKELRISFQDKPIHIEVY
jgi:predicted nucleic acid-binding protein